MADRKNDLPIDLGIYSKRSASRPFSPAELVAVALSFLWFLIVGLFYYFASGDGTGLGFDPLNFIMVLLAIFMPVALIWVGTAAARSARIMREESARLQSAIDAMRHTYVTQAQSGNMFIQPAMERKLDQIVAAQKNTAHSIATFASRRDHGEVENKPAIDPVAPTPEDQTSLELGTRAEDISPPVSVADFIRALHFPETAEDDEGFRALRRALRDRKTARLVQASQDVLTLLASDGIYMDDLSPDRARPEVWRKFAKGERGRAVAALGGIRDRSSLALAAGRMRQDPIFRDAVHHFLRQFDKTFVEFEQTATDADVSKLGDTRTARAFMLLGRVTGTFD